PPTPPPLLSHDSCSLGTLTEDAMPHDQAHVDAAKQPPRTGRALCPYCGGQSPAGSEECQHCGGSFDSLSKQATQNAMGAWYIRDDEQPFRPGCSLATLKRLIQRGKVVRETVLRGPTTRQFWSYAKDAPGVANLLGVCHNCHQGASADDYMCGHCGAVFVAPTDRQHLGLGPVRLLPGQASADQIAASSMTREVVLPPPPMPSPRPATPTSLKESGAGASAPGKGTEGAATSGSPVARGIQTQPSVVAGPASAAAPIGPTPPAPPTAAAAGGPPLATTRRYRRQIANLKALVGVLVVVNVVCLGLAGFVLIQTGMLELGGGQGAAETAAETGAAGAAATHTPPVVERPAEHGDVSAPAASPAEEGPTADEVWAEAMGQAELDTMDSLERAIQMLKGLRGDLPSGVTAEELEAQIEAMEERLDALMLGVFVSPEESAPMPPLDEGEGG
ncbi:MAG: hypothetical protein VYC34_10090, partial [Planctomycetota bacterium]|nr:hypothetical protein [Planctomycetota bacterium]